MALRQPLACLGSLAFPFLGGGDWPQFRGAQGTGAVPAAEIPLSWSEQENVAWKVELPGQGWSQPIMVGDTIYVTAAVGAGLERPMDLEQGVADPRTNEPGKPPDLVIEWRVLALDLASGKERWSRSAARGKPEHPIHPSNTWATETPAADAQGVYAFFGAPGTVAAFDPAGKELWQVELGSHPTMAGYGTASSPALHEGKLFVQCFNEEQAYLVCLDARTGRETWRAKHPEPGTSWSSPLVWRNEKRVEVVASSGRLITSHDPGSGAELWRVTGIVSPNSCSFAADPGCLYFGQKSPMANPPLYALSAGATGDLSPAQGTSELRSQAWAQKAAAPGLPSPVVADGLLYIATENLLACRDAATGELVYKERVPELVTVIASPIAVGDKLVLLDEAGGAAVVQVGPEFELAGRGRLDDLFWSTPSVAGDALLLRGVEHLYCLRR
jgi:outer membrane protein assembly factor BamB